MALRSVWSERAQRHLKGPLREWLDVDRAIAGELFNVHLHGPDGSVDSPQVVEVATTHTG